MWSRVKLVPCASLFPQPPTAGRGKFLIDSGPLMLGPPFCNPISTQPKQPYSGAATNRRGAPYHQYGRSSA
jgi:hypothetical protein